MRVLVASSLGIAAGIFAVAAAAALTGSMLAAIPIGALVGALAGLLAYKRPIVPLDDNSCSRGLKTVSLLATLVALVQLARLCVFMVDPSQTAYSVTPTSKWEVQHSCLSAYFVSAQAASTTPDVYANALYSMPDDDPAQPRKARMIGPFQIDVFEYPPPFLLLPQALRVLTPEFAQLRMLWFALMGAVVLLGLLLAARMMGPALGTRALLLSPLIWMAIPTLSTLQKGNVQALAIAASMLAMVLFERRRFAAGGALLAFMSVGKIYPGLLVIYLLGRRQWRALAWTVAFSIVFAVVALLDFGWPMYAAFLDHLPGLLGGEAFPAFRNPAAIAINFSIPGLIFKLKLFGVPGMTFTVSKIVAWIYTVVATVAVYAAGRRAVRDDQKPLVWLAILIIATLRSPFLPQAYAAFPPLWLLTLLAASWPASTKTVVTVLLAWLVFNIYWPLDWAIDPRWLALANLLPQALTVVFAVVVLRSLSPRRPPAAALSR